jgi:hypothetical protein
VVKSICNKGSERRDEILCGEKKAGVYRRVVHQM